MKHLIILLLVVGGWCSPVHAQVVDTVTFDDEEQTYEEETLEDGLDNNENSNRTLKPEDLNPTKQYRNESIRERRFDEKRWKEITGNADYEKRLRKNRTSRQREQDNNSEGGNGSGDGNREGNTEGGTRVQDDDNYVRDEESIRDQEEDYDEPEEENKPSESSAPWNLSILKWIIYTLAFLIICAILFLIFKNTSFKSNPKNRPMASDDHAEVEDIATLDVDNLLEKTQAAGNYKLAVRLYFLGLLKKLNEAGFIIWKKDKTNRDYLMELYAKARYYNEVRKLTLIYEQVWYGDHAIPLELYNRVKAEFTSVNQQINASTAQ